MKYYFMLFSFIVLYSCTSTPATEATASETTTPTITDSAAWVVENAIAHHGGANIEGSKIAFTFRDKQYTADRSDGYLVYLKTYTNEVGATVDDRLTDEAFSRREDTSIRRLSAKDSSAYANALNSVMYFAFLPYALQDPAVNLEYKGTTTIKGKSYYELSVHFSEDGGGKDFEDEYAYWFRQSNFQMDYLAYNFLVNGGGARFREAYNSRTVSGILFQDYINYKPANDQRDVLNFDAVYNAGGMDTLSLIELEEVR